MKVHGIAAFEMATLHDFDTMTVDLELFDKAIPADKFKPADTYCITPLDWGETWNALMQPNVGTRVASRVIILEFLLEIDMFEFENSPPVCNN